MSMFGRVVCVVGVGSIVGAACAQRFVRDGARVLAVDPDATTARSLCDELGDAAVPYAAGLASADGAAEVARRCDDLWGRLDVLVLCGSAMELWPSEEDTAERWREVFSVNVLGPVVYTEALEPLLRRSDSAAVVYLGSIDGLRGNPHVPAYSASKGGLVPLTHTMSQRLGAYGIRVNCVAAAGIVQTADIAGPPRRNLGDPDLARRLTPLGRMPVAEEIASVISFLASDDASYVTGTVLPVDGGRVAATPGTY